MSRTSLLEERRERILRAVALEAADRTPVVLEYAGFAAEVTGTPLAEFLESPATATEVMIRAYEMIGGGDGVDSGSFFPYALCFMYGAKVRVPGVDLPADKTWQVVDAEQMKVEDYDRILEMGWPAYFGEFIHNRILDDVPPERLARIGEMAGTAGKWAAVSVPVLTGGYATTPFELLCGSRTLPLFGLDLCDIPDKVEAVMEEIVPHLAATACLGAISEGCPGAWVGGWNAAPCNLSPAMWDRFVWPYYKRVVEEVVDSGLVAVLHLDSNWTRELARMRELPAGRCILSTDGETDLFRAKEILGDHMCLMGDVPAVMLFNASPGEVRDYCRRLIERLGPTGFILESGCDIPGNAKLANVQAMVRAATGD